MLACFAITKFFKHFMFGPMARKNAFDSDQKHFNSSASKFWLLYACLAVSPSIFGYWRNCQTRMNKLQTLTSDKRGIPVSPGFILLSSELCTPMILKINPYHLNRLFQTGKVQTKAEIIERNIWWQGSSSKRLFLELPGCTVRLNEA